MARSRWVAAHEGGVVAHKQGLGHTSRRKESSNNEVCEDWAGTEEAAADSTTQKQRGQGGTTGRGTQGRERVRVGRTERGQAVGWEPKEEGRWEHTNGQVKGTKEEEQKKRSKKQQGKLVHVSECGSGWVSE